MGVSRILFWKGGSDFFGYLFIMTFLLDVFANRDRIGFQKNRERCFEPQPPLGYTPGFIFIYKLILGIVDICDMTLIRKNTTQKESS